MNKYSQFLTIFEGCDGTGKSTAAMQYAEAIGARLVHFSDIKHAGDGLARMYVEAMLPAVLGYQHVVFDRSWLSETPYGEAYREGVMRLTQADMRMLERLAMRCSAVVVRCDPGWAQAKKNWASRKGQEMIKDPAQLRQVWSLYNEMHTNLPLIDYDYRTDTELMSWISEARRGVSQHPVQFGSAGNWDAENLIIGESFAGQKSQDAFYQWPFASFSNVGCSRWLTDQLIHYGISERNLTWINADENLTGFFKQYRRQNVYALGDVAAEVCGALGIQYTPVVHPQYHKRFCGSTQYQLISYLKGVR